VGGYDSACAAGAYRAYSVRDADGRRSTLGLCSDRRGRWAIDQHRGPCNGPISVAAAKAGRQLLQRYQLAQEELMPRLPASRTKNRNQDQ
jgi:hypothetical protein